LFNFSSARHSDPKHAYVTIEPATAMQHPRVPQEPQASDCGAAFTATELARSFRSEQAQKELMQIRRLLNDQADKCQNSSDLTLPVNQSKATKRNIQ
jgi:hypothetical protein